MGLLLFVLFVTLLFMLYKWSTAPFKTFAERGVPYQKPIPFFGNAWSFVRGEESLHKVLLRFYRQTKQHKIVGFFNFRQPFFIVNDPNLIKQMTIKDFDSFTNHQRIFNMEEDSLLSGMLTVMQDQRWRNMRNTVSPIFTGAKMRTMFTLMNDCFAESMKFLDQQCAGRSSVELDMKTSFFSRLSNDLIATTAFGIKTNSFENPENEFHSVGQSLTEARGQLALKFFFYSLAPKLFSRLGLTIFNRAQMDYFVRLVVDAMKYREAHNIVRPDMIHLLMQAKKESTQHWTDNELVAQCFIFFFAAFENNANLLCVTCHELMENPEVQQRLYEEIMETHATLNGKTVDYDALKDMKYLDMVLTEALRKWTLAAALDRECGKDYAVRDNDGNFICNLKKGDRVWFNAIGIHWDEQYYEDHESFNPERFSKENEHNLHPFTYLPFGLGPRSCIGNRYALMQAKAMLYYLLKDFKVERSGKSSENIMDDLRGFQFKPKNGFWLKFTKRT